MQSNETDIYLNFNEISELHPNEFSTYTVLLVIQMSSNQIRTISPSAFSGTQLNTLDISTNLLTVAPDLAAVLETLKSLTIESNPLIAFPNITMSGTRAELIITNQSKMLEDGIQAVSPIGWLVWKSSNLTNIPKFGCSSSKIHVLDMNVNDLDGKSNMSGLESVSQSLSHLAFRSNKFTNFPDLPMQVRMKLTRLYLRNNQISVIPNHLISGYKLHRLGLDSNNIIAITSTLLTVAAQITLHHNPLTDWDQCKWNKMMHGASSLNYLRLSGTMDSLTQLPDIHTSTCNRTQTLTLILESIPGPCNCSVQWMAAVTHEGCPVDLQTDKLQCGTRLEDMRLTCPQSGMILCDGDDLTGGTARNTHCVCQNIFTRISSHQIYCSAG